MHVHRHPTQLTRTDVQSLIDEGIQILDSIPDHTLWSKGSTHLDGLVQGRQRKHRSGEKLSWTSRTSRHKEPFEGFVTALLRDHSLQCVILNSDSDARSEVEAIESLQRAEKREVLKADDVEIWQVYYKTPWPSSNRGAFAYCLEPLTHADMIELIITRELTTINGRRSFVVVSRPIAGDKTPGYVRGTYASIERVSETEDDHVKWEMAVSSDSGGLIPDFITNLVLPGEVAKDVPSYLEWMKKRRESK